MPDGTDHPHDVEAPDQEAGEVGGAHEADRCGGKALLNAAHCNQRSLQAVAAEQDTRSEENRDQRSEAFHVPPPDRKDRPTLGTTARESLPMSGRGGCWSSIIRAAFRRDRIS